MKFLTTVFFVIAHVLLFGSAANAVDCNENEVEDAEDLRATSLTLVRRSGVGLASHLANYYLFDVNSDGNKDVLYGTQSFPTDVAGASLSFGLSLYEDGSFSSRANPLTSLFASRFAVGDFDGNSFLDLVFASEESQVIAYSQGDGTYSGVVDSSPAELSDGKNFDGTTASGTPETLLVDLQNDDSEDDEIGVSFESTDETRTALVEVRTRNESNTLEVAQSLRYDFEACNLANNQVGAAFLPLVDVDGDGDKDPAVLIVHRCLFPAQGQTVQGTKLVFLENESNGSVGPQVLEWSSDIRFSEFQDMNADGVLEFVMTSFQPSSIRTGGVPVGPPTRSLFLVTVEKQSTSKDRNGNDIPDECERAVPGDFDGDRKSDHMVIRSQPSGLLNWLGNPSAGNRFVPQDTLFGLSAFDTPYAGDFNGDGRVEPTVVRDAGDVIPGLFGLWWYSLLPDDSVEAIQFGLKGDVPIVGHFDLDTKSDRAVVRNVGGQLVWFIFSSETNSTVVVPWGLAGDQVFAANVAGDEKFELIVVRQVAGALIHYIRDVSSDWQVVVPWGLVGDSAITPQDVNGDGLADLTVTRPNGGLLDFYVRYSSGGFERVPFGLSTDVPYLGFFSNSTQAEPSVFRADIPRTSGNFFPEALHYQRAANGFVRLEKWGIGSFGDFLVRPDGTAAR